MKQLFLFFFLLLPVLHSFANDGAYRMSGNQLIPIQETTVSVKKEILSIKKVDERFIEVNVYYEFFNPDVQKEILVGFEAISPTGDVDGRPLKGEHPYMSHFTVEMNRQPLHYSIEYVADSNYFKNGTFESQSLNAFESQSPNNVDFFYVYHFNALFRKGINTVHHSYRFEISDGIATYYNFQYILSAAKRWSNRQIDDFTLLIDLGSFESFRIPATFFQTSDEWILVGIGNATRIHPDTESYLENTTAYEFNLRNGSLIFQQNNFVPNDELYIYSKKNYETEKNFDAAKDLLPFPIYSSPEIGTPVNDFSRKVLQNLSFARRGYVFKNVQLQQYFERQTWYIPDPNYKAELSELTPLELQWLEEWKEKTKKSE